MAVMGLGHIGYFVKDIEVMKDFWGNFMGMTLTKSTEGAGFYSCLLYTSPSPRDS